MTARRGKAYLENDRSSWEKGIKRARFPILLSSTKMNFFKTLSSRPLRLYRHNLSFINTRSFSEAADAIYKKGNPLIPKPLRDILTVTVPIASLVMAFILLEDERLRV